MFEHYYDALGLSTPSAAPPAAADTPYFAGNYRPPVAAAAPQRAAVARAAPIAPPARYYKESTNSPIPTVDDVPTRAAINGIDASAYPTPAPVAEPAPTRALKALGIAPTEGERRFGSPCDYGMCGPKVITPNSYDTANQSAVAVFSPTAEMQADANYNAIARTQYLQLLDRIDGRAPRTDAQIARDVNNGIIGRAMDTDTYRANYDAHSRSSGPDLAHQLALESTLGPNMRHVLAQSSYGQPTAAAVRTAAQNAIALGDITGTNAPIVEALRLNPNATAGHAYIDPTTRMPMYGAMPLPTGVGVAAQEDFPAALRLFGRGGADALAKNAEQLAYQDYNLRKQAVAPTIRADASMQNTNTRTKGRAADQAAKDAAAAARAVQKAADDLKRDAARPAQRMTEQAAKRGTMPTLTR